VLTGSRIWMAQSEAISNFLEIALTEIMKMR